MIRVLHSVGTMNMGGIETFIMNVYRNIDRTKVQFDFLVASNEECYYFDEIKKLGGRIYTVTTRRKNIILNKKELDEFFKNHREYNILHQHLSSLSYIEPLIAAKNNGVKIRIIHGHSTNQKGKIHKILHLFNKVKITDIVTDYFACSFDSLRWIAPKHIIYNENYEIIRNGIDVSLYNFNNDTRIEYRKKLNIKNNEFIIGHVGRFEYPKNHKYLIKIFSIYHKLNTNSKLLLVGSGSLYDEIKKEVLKLNIEDYVLFTGISRDVPQLMMAMDVFLFPSLYEGLGIVAIEAQASGLTCILSDKVPNEACITNKCKQLELCKPDKWIREISNVEKLASFRNSYSLKKIYQYGYNIKDVSEKLLDFYISKTKE